MRFHRSLHHVGMIGVAYHSCNFCTYLLLRHFYGRNFHVRRAWSDILPRQIKNAREECFAGKPIKMAASKCWCRQLILR